ncbi:MAG: uroporphyrinogen decarboxylase family protein [Verrucomicrobiota bacterium]
MTSRERLLAVLHHELPDCVPCCPDISNMIPCKLTGKPFWDIYVYQDPPLWKTHIDAVKYFDIDGGIELYDWGDLFGDQPEWERKIVSRNRDGSFVTQTYCRETDKWNKSVEVHTADNPCAYDVLPETIGLPPVPTTWETIAGIKQWPTGMELWKLTKREMGDHGIIGMPSGATTGLIFGPDEIYAYHDNPRPFYERRENMLRRIETIMNRIAGLDEKPDFLFCGSSGSLVWQTPEMFRELALPVLKKATEMACDLGIPTHVHSCGPERELVRMAAEETKLTVIDPLEIPPMGDCILKELKQRYGHKLVLKGNLHTTEVMLKGSVETVRTAARQAIDDAGKGGGFILSTGDQCGRDTPDENIRAMVDISRTYGKY